MKSLTFSPVVLVLVLMPVWAQAQLNAPLTAPMADSAAHSMQPRPAVESATQAVTRAWSGSPSAETPRTLPVALVEVADANYPSPPTTVPLHPWLVQTQVGQSTDALMQAQAYGTNAGPLLPTLGAAAGLSYQRYLKSFTLPLPATFEKTVETSK